MNSAVIATMLGPTISLERRKLAIYSFHVVHSTSVAEIHAEPLCWANARDRIQNAAGFIMKRLVTRQ